MPEGVQLISSKKEEFIGETGKRGTAVHLWFAFKDTGPVRLPPLIVIIGFRTYYIPFDDITVFENPDLINPQALVEFVSGAKFNRNFEEKWLTHPTMYNIMYNCDISRKCSNQSPGSDIS